MNLKNHISKILFFTITLLLSVVSTNVYAQNYNNSMTNIFGENLLTEQQQHAQDSLRQNQGLAPSERKVYRNRYKDSIQVYKIISFKGDTTTVDTSLNITKLYKMNPTRKDEYGYMPFPNIAEGYTPLVMTVKPSILPEYGFASRNMYWYNVEDIDYYNVRTPWSEAMYHSNVFSNMTGQVLDFKFTANAGSQFNFSFGFRGKRTFGLYNYSETHQGQFLATFNYRTKSYRYRVRGHFTFQYLTATENGGLTEEGDSLFRTGDKEFTYRKTLPVRLSGSDATVSNRLGGSRFYLDQSYDLFASAITQPKAFRVSILNEIKYQHKSFKYSDPAFYSTSGTATKSLEYYGSAVYEDAVPLDSSRYNTFDVAGGAGINFPLVNIYAQGMIRYQSTNYGFDTVSYASSQTLPNMKENGGTVSLSLLGRWRPIKYFGADGSLDFGLSGKYSGARILNLSAYVQLNKDYRLEGSYMNASYYPTVSSMYYRSSYVDFNWYNDFKRIEANELAFTLHSPKILNARVSFTDVSNYVYYDSLRVARQYDDKVNVLSVTLSRDTRIRWFGWDNTVTYQNVSSGSSVMPLPEINLRSTLYAYFPMFKKALTLMPAITLKYYSEFTAPMYNPLMSDYNLQPTSVARKIGGYPYLDFSISGKIRSTRLFLKLENFTPWVAPSNRTYYSSAWYPFLDPTVRFGVVWDWFN
ncbi:MAG: hypothetical protein PHD21_03700 [Flavobacteriales bacterium]|nr:hypothetical protein [Flavobacteriales bacterium]